MVHFLTAEQVARLNALPKNRRIVPGTMEAVPQTEMEVWKDGFMLGMFFGSLAVDAILLGLHYLNG